MQDLFVELGTTLLRAGQRERIDTASPGTIECAVLSCGPKALQDATKAACATAGTNSSCGRGMTFDYHSEEFEW